MNNNKIEPLLNSAIPKIEQYIEEEKNINKAGDELVKLLHEEMENQLHQVWSGQKKNSKLQQKPWWSDDLQTLETLRYLSKRTSISAQQ